MAAGRILLTFLMTLLLPCASLAASRNSLIELATAMAEEAQAENTPSSTGDAQPILAERDKAEPGVSYGGAEGQSANSSWGSEIYTGWLGDTEGNGFVYIGGAIDRILDERKALTFKFMASDLYYEYESSGRIINAQAPGIKLMAGMKFFRPGTFLAVTAGASFRNTDLDPDDPDSEVRGDKVGAVFDIHLIKDLTDNIVIDLLGSYSTTGDTLWGRGRYKHLIKRIGDSRKLYIGLEGVGEGNSDYNAYRVGGLAELQLLKKRFSVLFVTGFRHSSGVDDSAYFGLELYHRFK